MCLGVPGQITEIMDEAELVARVTVAGVQRAVNIACIVDEQHPPAACVGRWVLVHVGFAMSRLDEDEARRTLEILDELGEIEAGVAAMDASAAG